MPPSTTFMAAWTWLGPDSDPAVEALLLPERALLEQWRRHGVLLHRFISTDETRGWLVLRADSETALHALLDTLPLRQWLRFEITHLSE